jgi:acyl-CoA thioester hydrolase
MSQGKKFSFTIPMRFRDLDAMGHVNNAVYLTYFEEGRKEFFVNVLGSISPEDFPFILAQVTCNYIRPIELSERVVREYIWISKTGKKSFMFSYEITRDDDPAWVFSTGSSVQVFYDYEKAESLVIPESFKNRIADYVIEIS